MDERGIILDVEQRKAILSQQRSRQHQDIISPRGISVQLLRPPDDPLPLHKKQEVREAIMSRGRRRAEPGHSTIQITKHANMSIADEESLAFNEFWSSSHKTESPVVRPHTTNLSSRLYRSITASPRASSSKQNEDNHDQWDDSVCLSSTAITELPRRPASRPAARDMTLEEAIEWLQSAGENAYLHVCPRHAVQKVLRSNFYDVVVLEKPGERTVSGGVQNIVFEHKRHLLMKLSLRGLLCLDDAGAHDELLPLQEFLEERKQCNNLRRLRTFRMFREAKSLSAWRSYTCQVRWIRVSEQLKTCSIFKDTPIRTCLQEMQNVVYYIDNSIDMFAYQNPGVMNIKDFLSYQIAKINTIAIRLRELIERLADVIQQQYDILIDYDYFRDEIDEILAHHPAAKRQEADEEQIDVSQIRGVKRIQEINRTKVERVLILSQFLIETALGRVMETFWTRCSQFVCGIRKVNRNAQKGEIGYWDTQKNLMHDLSNERVVQIKKSTQSSASLDELLENVIAKTAKKKKGAEYDACETIAPDGQVRYYMLRELYKHGSYLNVDVSLVFGEEYTAVTVDENLSSKNMNQLKVKASPAKLELMLELHALYGAMGRMLEGTPNLRAHRIVRAGLLTPLRLPKADEFEHPELNNSTSSKYFTNIKISSVLSNLALLGMATRCMHQIRAAYYQAVDLDAHLAHLQDAFRKIWSMSPEALCKQVDRSMVLLRVKDIIEMDVYDPDEIDQAVQRDQSKISSIRLSIEHLQRSNILKEQYVDMRNPLGLVTTFRTILMQIDAARDFQLRRLFSRLPAAFLTRCKYFSNYMFKLKGYYLSEEGSLENLIFLLGKLKNYDLAKDALDVEMSICDDMRDILRTWAPPEEAVKMSHSVETAFKFFTEQKDELQDAIGRSRLLVLNKLKFMRESIDKETAKLHNEIATVVLKIGQSDISAFDDVDGSEMDEMSSASKVEAAHGALRQIGNTVTKLREEVNRLVHAQDLLHEGHLIVGAAACVLESAEIDPYVDMDSLEEYYQSKFKACTAILDSKLLLRRIAISKLGTCDIRQLYRKHQNSLNTLQYLKSKSVPDATCDDLQTLVQKLEPMLQLVTFLKSPTLKLRHWEDINEKVFEFCGLNLSLKSESFEGFVVNEVSLDGTVAPTQLGTFRSLPVKALLDRSILDLLDDLKDVAATACMEGMLERTLNVVDDNVNHAKVELSIDWLQEPRMRDKLFFELNRVTNCIQLGILLQYCLRAVLVVEHTAIDMHMSIYDDRLAVTRTKLQNMLDFVSTLDKLQVQWAALFHFVKFSPSGELDRDTERLFQTCTEDLKKIEIMLQTTPDGNFAAAYQRISESNVHVDQILASLGDVAEDVHSNIQSMLEALPRLSMLPYHRTKKLVKCWITNPAENLDFISSCMKEMYEGVGHLTIVHEAVLRCYMCHGFLSNDSVETIKFADPIPMTLSLDSFIRKFENQLRSVIERGSDVMIVHRVQSLRNMLSVNTAMHVLKYIRDLFTLRMTLMVGQHGDMPDERPNQSAVLVNMCLFAEDIWLCLGFPIGSTILARPDLNDMKSLFAKEWKTSLEALLTVCKENIAALQAQLQSGTLNQKIRFFYGALFQLEVSYVIVIEELKKCKCIDSAIEQWAGKYQLRFLYDKNERVSNSPFEVTLGCISIPYGLEYHGGAVRAVTGHRMEHALQKVVGSSFVFKGTVFVSYDDENFPTEAVGEYAVSCRDIAAALGRVYTSLASIQNEDSVKLLLARLLYLDAVGCIDFTTISHDSLQLLLSSLTDMWTAIEKRDDFFMVGTLKYPLKTRYAANAIRMTRRKSNVSELRDNLAARGSSYNGMFVIGMASETLYSDIGIFDYFSKSAFNTVAIQHHRPIEDLGLLLAMEGFKYGMLLQTILQEVIKLLHEKFHYQSSIQFLSSSRLIRTIVKQATQLLVAGKSNIVYTINEGVDAKLLRLEMECLYAVVLEQILLLGDCKREELQSFHVDIRRVMQEHLDTMLDEESRFSLGDGERITKLVIPPRTVETINRAMNDLGYIKGSLFVEQCSSLWRLISSQSHCVVIMSGPTACGKTAVRETVLRGIESDGYNPEQSFNNVMALQHWRAAMLLSRVARRWLSKRESHQAKARARTISTDDALALFGDKRGCKVFKTVVHHTSLTTDHLLGSFDSEGKWNDGLLCRKIRESDEVLSAHRTRSGEAPKAIQCFVLVGPLGSHVEQLFSASHFHSSKTNVILKEVENGRVCFPSGETIVLHPTVMFIIESSDLSQASPPMLMHSPHIHCSVDNVHCFRRIVQVWLASFKSWAQHITPWSESVNEITDILTRSGLIAELVQCDVSHGELNSLTIVARVSTFLRFLEELLHQAHLLMLEESTWQQTPATEESIASGNTETKDDSDESDDDDRRAIEQITGHHDNINLSVKGKDRLLTRVRLSIVYACIWGFGGSFNGTNRRNYFDIQVRQAFDNHIPSLAAAVPMECVFELLLDLNACRLYHSFDANVLSTTVGCDDKILHYVANGATSSASAAKPDIVPEALIQAFLVNTGNSMRMQFHTPSTRATFAAFELLLQAGSNILVLGPSCSGKSSMIREIMEKYGKHRPTPQTMRREILRHLMDIIGDDVVPDGIPTILSVLQQVMYHIRHMTPLHDETTDFNSIWDNVKGCVQKLLSGTAHKHCSSKTMSVAAVTLRSVTSAAAMREWLAKELRTENDRVLEHPRKSFGVVFLDDLHLCTNKVTTTFDNRSIQDRPEGLATGLLAGSKPFGIERKLLTPDEPTHSAGRASRYKFPMTNNGPPILHCTRTVDPRLTSRDIPIDYCIHQLNVVAAATGELRLLQKTQAFGQMVPYMSVISMSALSSDELRSAIIHGSQASLMCDPAALSSADYMAMSKHITELTAKTVKLSRILDHARQDSSVTAMESSVIPIITLQVHTVAKLCLAVHAGRDSIKTSANLLQLWSHEWKRQFVDPLPLGSLRTKICWAVKSQLNSVDARRWNVTTNWLHALTEEIDNAADTVWINTSVLNRGQHSSHANDMTCYEPLLMTSVDSDVAESEGNPNESGYANLILKMPKLNGLNNDVRSVLYPQAMSFVLRLVRVLKSLRSSILIPNYAGSQTKIALQLAAHLCDIQVCSFDVKYKDGAVAFAPTEQAQISLELRRFLKSVSLISCGMLRLQGEPVRLINPMQKEQKMHQIGSGSVTFKLVEPVRVLMVINGGQLLSEKDKRLLVALCELNDPCMIFEDSELTGMAAAMRAHAFSVAEAQQELATAKKISEQARRMSQMPVGDDDKRVYHEEGSDDDSSVESGADANVKSRDDDQNLSVSLIDLSEESVTNTTSAEPRKRVKQLMKRIHDIHGYTYQWVKSHLHRLIGANLLTALLIDCPRAVELAVPKSIALDDDALSEGAFDPNKGKSDHSAPQVPGKRKGTHRRFTLLSKKALDRQAPLMTPTELHVKDMELSKAKRGIDLADDSIFSCPILAPLFRRSFALLWWEIAPVHSSCGVVRSMFKHTTNPLLPTEKHCQFSLKLCKYVTNVEDTGSVAESRIAKDSATVSQYDVILMEDNINTYPKMSALHTFGIFNTYGEGDNMFDMLSDSRPSEARRPRTKLARRASRAGQRLNRYDLNADVDAMMMQVPVVLSRLLSCSLPTDNLILTYSSLIIDMERGAHIASEIVHNIISAGAKMLLLRRQKLSKVMITLKDAMDVLLSIDRVKSRLDAQHKELMLAVRDVSTVLNDITGEIELLHEDDAVMDTSLYDEYCQKCTTLAESEQSVQAQQVQLDKDAINTRAAVNTVSAKEWSDFSKSFTKRPKELFVAAAYAVLMISGNLPTSTMPHGVKSIDVSAVCRASVSSFKSSEFIQSFVNLSAKAISQQQLQQLKDINRAYSGEAVDDPSKSTTDMDDYSLTDSSLAASSSMHTHNSGTEDSQLGVVHKLMTFLRSFEQLCDMSRNISETKSHNIEQTLILEDFIVRMKAELTCKVDALEKKYNHHEQELHYLETELTKTKEKMQRLYTVSETSARMIASVTEASLYIQKELGELDAIMKHIVADSCIAAVILVRAGWTPEQVRQECMDMLKAEVAALGGHASDTPYIAGCLIDRLQIRTWTQYVAGYIQRDIPSINSMSLYFLSPCYTFVIDPDCVAEPALRAAITEEYDYFATTGSHFSLLKLKNWIDRTCMREDFSAAIIISDVQAGASDDLIAFLSAEVHMTDVQRVSSEHTDESVYGKKAALTIEYDPIYPLASHMSRLLVLHRVRVVLLSTQPPTLDRTGIGRPLPASCFKNMLVVHWVAAITSSFLVDTKPLNEVMHKTHASSSLLEATMVEKLCDTIAPDHLSKLNMINTRIVDYTFDLYMVESSIITTLAEWIGNEATSRKPSIGGTTRISQPIIRLSFLENAECCQRLVAGRDRREIAAAGLKSALKLERGMLTYHRVLMEKTAMAGDFLRMCSTLIPRHLLPPEGFGCTHLLLQYITPCVQSLNSHVSIAIPNSISAMQALSTAVRAMQKKYRNKLRQRKGGSSSSLTETAEKVIVVAKAAEVSTISSAPPTVAAPKLTSRGSFRGSLKVPRKSVKTSAGRGVRISELIGVKTHMLESYASDLHAITQPISKMLLTGAVDYMLKCIRPGLEWMVKFSLILTTWCNADPLPLDELRGLLMLMWKAVGGMTSLFSVSYPVPRTGVTDIYKVITGESSTALKRNSMSPMKLSGGTAIVPLQQNKDTWMVAAEHGINTSTAASPNLTGADWTCRGAGAVEGLWLHRRGHRWRISSVDAQQSLERHKNGYAIGAVINRWDVLLRWMDECGVVAKNALFRPQPRARDDFLLEWMRLQGARVQYEISVEASMTKSQETVVAGRESSVSTQSRRSTNMSATSGVGRVSRRNRSKAVQDASSSAAKKSLLISTSMRRSVGSRSIRKQSVSISPMMMKSAMLSPSTSFETPPPSPSASPRPSPHSRLSIRNPSVAANSALFGNIAGGGLQRQSSFRGRSVSNAPQASSGSPAKSYSDTKRGMELLLDSAEAVQDFRVLERHSAFAYIFSGLSQGMGQHYAAFKDWKQFMESLSEVNWQSVVDFDLVEFAASVLPPQLASDEEEEIDSYWASGKELTVLQSLMLVAAGLPSCLENVMQLYFSLVKSYLRKGYVVMKHKDEFSDDEDSDEEEDEFDEDDGEGYQFGNIPDRRNPFGTITECEDEEESDEENSSDEDVFDDATPADDNPCDEYIFFLNSWISLKRIAGGTRRGRSVRTSRHRPRKLLSCRDFEDWESVLADTLELSSSMDKLDTSGRIAASFNGQSGIFLASDMASHQMANLSHLAREYAIHKSTSVINLTIVNCKIPEPRSTWDDTAPQMRKLHTLRSSIVAALKQSLNSSTRRGTIVEMLNIQQPLSNLLLKTAIWPSFVAPGVEDNTNPSSPRGNRRQSAVAASSAPQDSASVDDRHYGEITSVPCVISGEWNPKDNGMGPLSRLSHCSAHWLHSYSFPDLIGRADTPFQSAKCISKYLSAGVILDNLESNSMWITNSTRRLARTKMSDNIRERLRYLSRIETRTTSVLITMWQMSLCLQSRIREMNDQPGVWSACLEPLNLWQLARVMLKISDMLKDPEWRKVQQLCQGSTDVAEVAAAIMENDTFRRSVCLMTESFCKFQYDDASTAAPVPVLEPPTKKKAFSKARFSTLMRTSSNDSSPTKSLLSHYKDITTSPINTSNKRSTPIRPESAQQPSSRITLIMARPASVDSPHRPSSTSYTAPIPTRPAYEKPSQIRRKRRIQMQMAAAETAPTYLSFESLSSMSLYTLGSLNRLFIKSDLRDRIFAMVGVYMSQLIANIICRKGKVDLAVHVPHTAQAPTAESAQPITAKSSLPSRRGPRYEEFGENWPIFDQMKADITVGAISPEELSSLMVLWTLDKEPVNMEDKKMKFKKFRQSMIKAAKSATPSTPLRSIEEK